MLPPKMNWKKFLLLGVGWGLGTAAGLAVILACYVWYQSRPKPPKPWNRTSIKAEYNYVDIEGSKNSMLFNYTLENATDFDYHVEDVTHGNLNAMLSQQNSLIGMGEAGKLDYPISVPARKRVECLVHLTGYTYLDKMKSDADLQERRKYRAGVESYIAKEMKNLDGFDLLDEKNRYEIVFPSGWKSPKPQ